MKQKPLNAVDYYSDFPSMLKGIRQKFGEKEAVACYSRRGERFSYSYEKLYQDAAHLCAGLQARGLAGKHIAVVGENSYSWLTAYLGIILSGGVAVCIDIEQPDAMIRSMIRQADCEMVFVSSSLLPMVKSLAEENSLSILALLDGECPPYSGMERFCAQGAELPEYTASIMPDQPAVILYTSGTTVAPRPVVLSHRAILTNVSDALSMLAPQKKIFSSLPFYHAYGMSCSVLAGLIGGLGICINGNLKTMLRDLFAYQPGSAVVVPLIAESIHKMIWAEIERSGKKEKVTALLRRFRFLGRPAFLKKRIRQEISLGKFESLKLLICGGAYLAVEIAEDLTDFGISVIQGYGITECSPLVTVNRTPDPFSVGFPLPHVELRLSEEGEILVRGESLMSGYYAQPELTQEAVVDGWFHTGDLGKWDRKGRLCISGRKKNLIVLKNGKKISVEEIEGYFANISLIKEIIAYGAVTGNSTDDVKLSVMIYPDPEMTQGMTSYEILDLLQKEVDRVNTRLPAYKQIQMINLREQEFERTSIQKIRRQIV
jgi:long-chain acyl-CoA synthetase